MSKYNLTELLSEVKGGRIGTLNITAMDLERKMEELEDEGIKVNTFDGDNFGKTYIEYHVHPKAAGAGKGPTAKQKKRMNEVRIDREVADKIESMLSIPLKAKFLDAFDDVWEDLTEDDMFYPEDVINHLNNEMHKRLSLYRTPDPKPEEIPMFKGTRDALDDISIREEDKEMDFIRALKVDANGTSIEIKSYLESLKRSGDKFDSVDDYVEDFKNYVADKALQEHFNRFM